MNDQSWVKKYEPKTLKDIVGNTNVIKDAMKYIKSYRTTRDTNAEGFSKAMLISGPGGCGKTMFAKILALYRGYICIEMSASLLRRKEEIQHFIDVYKSDITHNYSDNHPLVKKARKFLIAHSTPDLPIGKCILLDEVDSVGKSEKGLITDVIELLKQPNHNPDTLMMITCDTDTAERLKTLRNYCYCVGFRAIADDGMLKLINKVCEGENLILSEDDKKHFINYANGDGRRLLNGMEMCFKNGIAEYDSNQISELIQRFVNNNDDIIKKLQYSTWSAEKILSKVVGTLIAPYNNGATANITTSLKRINPNTSTSTPTTNTTSTPKTTTITTNNNLIPMALISVIEPEIHVIPVQLFQTYINLLRQDIPPLDQINILADTVEEISLADISHQNTKLNNPGIMSEDNGDSENSDYKMSDYYIISSTLIPIARMKKYIAKTYKTNVYGYAKLFGLLQTQKGQYNAKVRLKSLSGYFNQREYEELSLIGEKIANMLKSKQYDQLTNFFMDIHTSETAAEVLDELANIKILSSSTLKLTDVWKTNVKREFSKEFVKQKPKNTGVKFKTSNNTNSDTTNSDNTNYEKTSNIMSFLNGEPKRKRSKNKK